MFKYSFFILCFFCSMWMSALSASVETELKAANATYAALDMDAALSQYKALYERCPDNFEVLWKLIRSYGDAGEEKVDEETKENYFLEAKALAEILRQKYPETYEADLFAASTYGNLAQFANGKQKVRYAVNIEKYAKLAQEKAPEEAFPYLILGVYYKEVAELNGMLKFFAKTFFGGKLNGSYDLAIENLNLATEYNPDLILPFYQRALIYDKKGQKDKEIEQLEQLIKLPVIDNLDPKRIQYSKERLLTLKN